MAPSGPSARSQYLASAGCQLQDFWASSGNVGLFPRLLLSYLWRHYHIWRIAFWPYHGWNHIEPRSYMSVWLASSRKVLQLQWFSTSNPIIDWFFLELDLQLPLWCFELAGSFLQVLVFSTANFFFHSRARRCHLKVAHFVLFALEAS